MIQYKRIFQIDPQDENELMVFAKGGIKIRPAKTAFFSNEFVAESESEGDKQQIDRIVSIFALS